MSQTRTVIYRHPAGRFRIEEVTGTNKDGTQYSYRETVTTPEKDNRGVLHEEINNKVMNSGTGKKEKNKGRFTNKEKIMIMDMYQSGWPIVKIARCMHRSVLSINTCITRELSTND